MEPNTPTVAEACIVLPVGPNAYIHNQEHEDARLYLERELCEAFGGWTRHTGLGAWMNSKHERELEDVLVYNVAMPVVHANHVKLRDIAQAVCRMANQQSVYIRLANGQVEFVERAASAATANGLTQPCVDVAAWDMQSALSG